MEAVRTNHDRQLRCRRAAYTDAAIDEAFRAFSELTFS